MATISTRSFPPRVCPGVEELEPRRLLSGYPPTAAEQLFLERLNDARANPVAYGNSIGVNLAGVLPSPPLAFQTTLIQAAHDHSQDMNVRNYFSHYTPEGQGPGERLTAYGFPWMSWGESIAAGYATPEQALAGLIADVNVPTLDHRRHLLAMDPLYQNQNQVGVGIIQGGTGYYTNYYTIDTASTADARPFLTGVVFNDTNGNGLYDTGEGLANVTISIAGVGSTTTFATGGYSLQVSPGTYTVTASGGPLAAPLIRTVTVGTTNYRLNFNVATFQSDAVPVQVVSDAAGRQEMFALGIDNQVWAQKFDVAGNSTSGYFLATPGMVKAFAATRDAYGNPLVFAIGLDSQVYREKFDGNGNPVGGYVLTQPGLVNSITLGHDASNRPELFVIGMDGQIWAQKFDFAGNSASGYFLTQPAHVLAVAVGSDVRGNPELFAIQTDCQVYGQKLTATGSSASGWFLTAAGAVKAIQVGHDASNRPELFAIGFDDQVFSQKFDSNGTPASPWTLTTGGQVKGITLGYDAFNDPEVFAIGLNDLVYTERFDPHGNSASGYAPVPGGYVRSATVGRDAYNNPELFVIGQDTQVWGMKFDGYGNPISGYFLTAPGYVK